MKKRKFGDFAGMYRGMIGDVDAKEAQEMRRQWDNSEESQSKGMIFETVGIDKDVKEAAEQVLRSIGMSLNTGINVFLAQVVQEQALPFRPGKGSTGRKISNNGVLGGDLGRRYDPNDPVVRKAIEITLKQGKFSTASLQTWLGKGHGFVSGLAIWLEEIGVIGPANGSKQRDVLIQTMEEFEEKAR